MVTGGGRRVGRAIVLELARAGCGVAIHHRHSGSAARELAAQIIDAGGRAVTVCGDLNNPADWPAIIERTVSGLDHLDILVNNASAFLTDEADTIGGFSRPLWERMLRTNLVSIAALCHYAEPHFAARGQGKIVNLCDISAERPWPDHLAYGVSKAGVAALTRGLARALAPTVQVNGVAPGVAVFPDTYSEDLRRELTSRVPLGRAGTPEEVAMVVRFLAESAEYVTGEIIRIDGGRSLV